MQLPTKYSSGCKSIDELLGGGFESGTVTQLYGEAGSGKTNICLQMAVECSRKGKTVIFIDSEGFSPERFLQIANAKPNPLPDLRGRETESHSANTNETSETVECIAQRISIYEPHSFEQQTSCIDEIEELIKEKEGKHEVALVILDSATLFYRLELDEERSIYLRRVLANQIMHLLELARRYDLAVIITNQVYMDIEAGNLRPSGGYALEHLSKVIVQLEKAAEGRGKRRAILKKHRSMPEDTTCEFFITGEGVE
ncbi:DNA repair and recombination protein RadB [ANME-1 cluster archaeon GoMg1]|nr:DNA repair and recombination protein RadB [ANME-1 cluster archaeon GoMg1]